MSQQEQFSEKQQDILRKVEKMMRIAASTSHENEAAAMTTRAMELLAAYNLDIAAVDIEGQSSGKRAEEALIGGFYQFERDLWRAVSELNFVWYFTQLKYIPAEERVKKHGGVRKHTHQHVFIGKVVNIAATKAMAGYLMQAIERITREKADAVNMPPRSSWAVSFRRGAAERIIEKLQRRRWEHLDAEERRATEAAEKAREAGVATVETALTLKNVVDRENAANYDFKYGKGAYAKRQAEILQYRKERAEARAQAEAEYTAWAAAHPEEAAKAEAERIKRERANANRRTGRTRFAAFKGDWSAYSMGREAGKNIGLDPQTEGARSKGLLK
jgi:hypothetical protein